MRGGERQTLGCDTHRKRVTHETHTKQVKPAFRRHKSKDNNDARCQLDKETDPAMTPRYRIRFDDRTVSKAKSLYKKFHKRNFSRRRTFHQNQCEMMRALILKRMSDRNDLRVFQES
jgi:hypothetical protein